MCSLSVYKYNSNLNLMIAIGKKNKVIKNK